MSPSESCCFQTLLNTGGVLRVDILAPGTFRVRLGAGETFVEPPMIRYGVLRREWPSVDAEIDDAGDTWTISTAEATLRVAKADGQFVFSRADGTALTQSVGAPWSNAGEGFGARFSLRDGEKFYGLGDVTRDRVQMRGHRAEMWVRNVASYVPAPWLMGTGGWGVFFNTTWRHTWDIGATEGDVLRVGGRRGPLDFYLFAGEGLPYLLRRFTELAGTPALLPQWAYGLTFVCNQQANAREMLDDCLQFRREGMPCDVIGLEPGWMGKYYDYSVEKDWHEERFYLPHWSRIGSHIFSAAARRMGFKLSLWLCCNYDLLYEEERRITAREASRESAPAAPHPDDFEQDQNFGHGAIRSDTLTKPGEAWFTHLKRFVDEGACAFKMDGALQVNEHPDRMWGQGIRSEALPDGFMCDEEMHNLYPLLLNKQMSGGFSEHTGRRAMIYSSGGYAGIGQYAATWAGDTGGGPRPLVSLINHGLSGHSNTSCDMDVFTPAGIHFGFLMPWAQVCSWAYWRHPWLLGDTLKPIFLRYVKLRYRLMPYLYCMAHEAHRTGMPMLRGLPLCFPGGPRADELTNHYMLGDAFFTSAFGEELHLPEGIWYDFWTGEKHIGPKDFDAYPVPDDCGGPLFVRTGAVVPMAPPMDYWGQKPLETVEWHVWPNGESRFTLVEDDGETFAYRDGRIATTEFVCRSEDGTIEIEVGERIGDYDGIPPARTHDIVLHMDAAPRGIRVNGEAPDGEMWSGGTVRISRGGSTI